MSGEHTAMQYSNIIPEDGPWIIVIGAVGDATHVGPFLDSDEVIHWYELHGDGQPFNVIGLVAPDDYPGVRQSGPIPLPDPQTELPLG